MALLLAAALTSGCRGLGPRLTGEVVSAPPAGEPPHPRAVRPGVLDDSAFSSIEETNHIPAEWLHPPTNLFRLGPGDTIGIESFGDAAASGTATVGPDGKIYYSLLPGLFVWGLTLTETKGLLETEMARYTRVKPEFSVTLRAVGSKRFWMLGSVASPGVYSLATPMTLLEAMTLAGGPVFAPGSPSGMPDLQRSFVMRQGRSLPVDFTRLLAAGDLSQNIYLQPDDFVYLQAETTRDVFVMGAVRGPLAVPYSEHLTLLSALAAAGGTIPYARVSHVAVVRGSLASPRIALLDYQAISRGTAQDVRLEPGDIVYVPFVPFYRLAILAESIIRQYVLQVTSNQAYRMVFPDAQPVPPGVAPPPVP
jgi:protein involved in polysaccharide export with SLBB domain